MVLLLDLFLTRQTSLVRLDIVEAKSRSHRFLLNAGRRHHQLKEGLQGQSQLNKKGRPFETPIARHPLRLALLLVYTPLSRTLDQSSTLLGDLPRATGPRRAQLYKPGTAITRLIH